MSSGVSSVDFTDDLPDPEDEKFLVPGVEVGVGEAMRHSGGRRRLALAIFLFLMAVWNVSICMVVLVHPSIRHVERSSRDFR